MRAQIRESLFVERMVAALSAAFGLLATLLAALGLYGVMAFAVALRTREIGIRMALGAQRRDVMGMVLRDVAILVALGVAVGLPGGYGIGRVIETQLFGLDARDPLTFAVATATLLRPACSPATCPRAGPRASTPWWRCARDAASRHVHARARSPSPTTTRAACWSPTTSPTCWRRCASC